MQIDFFRIEFTEKYLKVTSSGLVISNTFAFIPIISQLVNSMYFECTRLIVAIDYMSQRWKNGKHTKTDKKKHPEFPNVFACIIEFDDSCKK